MKLLPAEPLARHSTFHAGGRADVVLVESGAELEARAATGDLPPDIRLVLGGGSNVLVSDDGVNGTVLMLRSGVTVEDLQPDGEGVVWIDGAADWSTVALSVTRRGWRGLESMVGIPGTVGGAVVQSIGAYGYELRDLVVEVSAVDLATGAVVRLAPSDIEFRYRNSNLKAQQPPRRLVTGVSLRLERGGLHRPRYTELARELRRSAREVAGGYEPTDVAEAVLALRRGKAMVYDASDPQTWGAGSFFKNPEVTDERFRQTCEQLGAAADDVPHWRVEGLIRLSAGWLVERSGYQRGHREGDVALCNRHALGIVNLTGRASARALAAFAGRIRQAVYEHSGVVLEPEPVLVGLELPAPAGPS